MKTNYKIAIALVAGVTIGGAAIQGLHAQAKPPVYLVVDISEVTNPEDWKAVTGRPMTALDTIMKDFGGRYLIRTDKITALEGTASKRLILIAFDNVEKAKGWYNSAEQKKVNENRMKNTKSRAFIVDGM
jgi:uncharacterized protein (DUF1330 family)